MPLPPMMPSIEIALILKLRSRVIAFRDDAIASNAYASSCDSAMPHASPHATASDVPSLMPAIMIARRAW